MKNITENDVMNLAKEYTNKMKCLINEIKELYDIFGIWRNVSCFVENTIGSYNNWHYSEDVIGDICETANDIEDMLENPECYNYDCSLQNLYAVMLNGILNINKWSEIIKETIEFVGDKEDIIVKLISLMYDIKEGNI